MPITISYNEFTTQTGDMPSGASQPYQYSGIKSAISDLDADDRTIIFTNLPSGLEVVQTLSTEPFDSVFIDIAQYDDYILMKQLNDQWQSSGVYSGFAVAYTSGGFWAAGEINGNSPGTILTGAGNENSSILDISFNGIDYMNTTFTRTEPEEFTSISLERGKKYTLDGDGSLFYLYSDSQVNFYQNENYSWYPVLVETSVINSGIVITGLSFNSVASSVNLPQSGIFEVYWSGDQLNYAERSTLIAPAPFQSSSLAEGYGWNATYANENFSSYNILSNNSGNTGTAAIQLNAAATNGEQFTDLIIPLRKLYVTFTDNP